MSFAPPPRDCALCPRLVEFRCANRAKFPDQFNAPVPPFGNLGAGLLIVGLAPGLQGANFTGRPFTGDYAGDLLYATLLKFGLARGRYQERADDGLELVNVRITNAVRCVPPQNKPTPAEEKTCRPFLVDEIAAMPHLKTILSLGLVSHNAVIKTLGLKISAYKFAHGAVHTPLPKPSSLKKGGDQGGGSLTLIDSYHCSRYNTNTGRLTPAMFEAVFAKMLNG